MSCSLVVNLFPPNHFFSSLEIKNSYRGLNLAKILDGEAIRSGIRLAISAGHCEPALS